VAAFPVLPPSAFRRSPLESAKLLLWQLFA
jgi:hypothetical protein